MMAIVMYIIIINSTAKANWTYKHIRGIYITKNMTRVVKVLVSGF